MNVQQLSVFVENKPGKLADIMKLLASNNVNIRALALADTSSFGVLRLIVNDLDTAAKALAAESYTFKFTEVLAVYVPDEPGSLSKILDLLSESGQNLEYMFGFVTKNRPDACMVLRVPDVEAGTRLLEGAGIETVKQEDLKNF